MHFIFIQLEVCHQFDVSVTVIHWFENQCLMWLTMCGVGQSTYSVSVESTVIVCLRSVCCDDQWCWFSCFILSVIFILNLSLVKDKYIICSLFFCVIIWFNIFDLHVFACSRHVLRFSVTSPLGYQLHLCSTTNFIFGDEEKVSVELTKVYHYAYVVWYWS